MVKAGDALVTVHGDADPDRVSREIEQGFDKGAELAEADLKQTGREIGDTISKSAGKEIEKQGPELAKSIEKGIAKRKIKVKTTIEPEIDHNAGERIVSSVIGDIERAFSSAGGGGKKGGPFAKIGAAFSDAIGAGFNVSGKSPLIVLLIPLIGAIIGLVVAALQAVNGLIAALATIPALIAAIGLQVGALAFAFHGVGDAIQGAFAAKNAKELQEAIKGLTPAAQQFVRQLLPLRDLFTFIAKQAQQAFFSNLGDILPKLQLSLGRVLGEGFPALAGALGQLFRDIALFFASPTFVEFIRNVIPSTMRFLEGFAPQFIHFLEGFTSFSTAILPFLEKLGMMLGGTLFQFGDFLKRVTESGDLQKWLDSMQKTLELVLELFGGLVEFVTVFLAQLDEAGGQAVIQSLIDAFEMLAFFFSTDVGKKALEGLIDFAIIAIKVTTGLILAIFLLLAYFEALAEQGKVLVTILLGGLEALGAGAVWLFQTVGAALMWFFTTVGEAIMTGFEHVKQFFIGLWHAVTDFIGKVITDAKALPGKILTALGDFGNLLFNAGKDLIEGLIRGIKNKLGPLGAAIGAAAQLIRDHWPFSPAKEGPLSGSGDPMIAGQKTMERFAEGIRMEIPNIQAASNEATSNIVFGRDAIRVTFEGALPTEQQAQQTGAAVGAGINGQLAARNTRLAVRTL